MTTVVNSSSPVSPLSSGTVAPSVGVATSGPVAAAGGEAEASDFNAVLSPLLGDAEAAVQPVATSLLVPETMLAGAETPVPAVVEGLDLTAVLQQTAAGAGNAMPGDGKILPAMASGGTGEVSEDLPSPLTLPPVEGDLESLLTEHAAAPAQSEQILQDDGEMMAELALPPQMTAAEDGKQSAGTTVVATGPNSDGATTDSKAEHQVLPPGVSVQPTVESAKAGTVAPATVVGANEPQTDATVPAGSPLSNSRPVAQPADTATLTALAPSSDNVDMPAPNERAGELSVPTVIDGDDDAVRSAGFGRLLEAQATANTTSQQPASDSAAQAGRMLTGAVAYRMDGTTQVATALVNQPVDTPQWSNEIGERVVWFGANKIQHAEIELDPPELGPLQVRITTQNDQTTVTFTSHHAAVREVLDQSLPRLKEMFSEQGLNLVQADVGERRGTPQQQQNDAQDAAALAGSAAGDDDDVGSATMATASKMRLGLVDAYA